MVRHVRRGGKQQPCVHPAASASQPAFDDGSWCTASVRVIDNVTQQPPEATRFAPLQEDVLQGEPQSQLRLAHRALGIFGWRLCAERVCVPVTSRAERPPSTIPNAVSTHVKCRACTSEQQTLLVEGMPRKVCRVHHCVRQCSGTDRAIIEAAKHASHNLSHCRVLTTLRSWHRALTARQGGVELIPRPRRQWHWCQQ